jgi:hypothetical protein
VPDEVEGAALGRGGVADLLEGDAAEPDGAAGERGEVAEQAA